eukprot:m.144366 g.144366  ORF g.144366 m.144366 type:complete len:413 (+) comp16193_c0_seq2:2014-3252(+)
MDELEQSKVDPTMSASEDEAAPPGLLDVNPVVTGKRQRKQAAPELTYEVKEAKSLATNAGKGQILKDSVRITEALEKFRVADPVVKLMHRLFYDVEGKQTKRKINIRDFSGLSTVTPEIKEKKNRGLQRATNAQLRALAKTLQLPTAGTKDELCDRLVDFACEPTYDASKKSLKKRKPASKGKRASTKSKSMAKKASRSKASTTAAVSAFELFFKDAKLAHEAKDPSISAVKLTLACRKEFASLSEDDRAVYEDMAKEANQGDAMDEEGEDPLESDDDNDDEADDDEDFEEQPKPKKKRAKAAAKKPKASPKKKKKGKATSAELALSDSDEEEEQQQSQPTAVDSTAEPSDAVVKQKLHAYLDAQDLTELSMKQVRVAMAKAFPNADMSHFKELIQTTTAAVVAEQQSSDDE